MGIIPNSMEKHSECIRASLPSAAAAAHPPPCLALCVAPQARRRARPSGRWQRCCRPWTAANGTGRPGNIGRKMGETMEKPWEMWENMWNILKNMGKYKKNIWNMGNIWTNMGKIQATYGKTYGKIQGKYGKNMETYGKNWVSESLSNKNLRFNQ